MSEQLVERTSPNLVSWKASSKDFFPLMGEVGVQFYAHDTDTYYVWKDNPLYKYAHYVRLVPPGWYEPGIV